VNFCRRVDLSKVNKKTLESLIKAGALDKFGTRASMLSALDKILESGHKEKKLFSSGQTSLFGAESLGENENEEIKLQDIEEFDKRQLLAFEKELFGFYLSEHPMQRHLSFIRSKTTHSLGELSSDDADKRVKIGGIISELRKVTTKNGNNEMAIVKIEDETGSIEAVVFPKVYASTSKHLILDQIVIVSGRIDNREDRFSLIVENVLGIDDSAINSEFDKQNPLYPNELEIRVPQGTRLSELEKLNSLLKKFPGSEQVVLIFSNPSGEKMVRVPFGIDFSGELKRQIADIWQS
jgi:DNA polymerase-3 subunit alpha